MNILVNTPEYVIPWNLSETAVEKGLNLFVDTTESAVQIQLPLTDEGSVDAMPKCKIRIFDAAGTFETNPVTVITGPEGDGPNFIKTGENELVLDKNETTELQFVYDEAEEFYGWSITDTSAFSRSNPLLSSTIHLSDLQIMSTDEGSELTLAEPNPGTVIELVSVSWFSYEGTASTWATPPSKGIEIATDHQIISFPANVVSNTVPKTQINNFADSVYNMSTVSSSPVKLRAIGGEASSGQTKMNTITVFYREHKLPN